ncbi:MAG: hypothetical protein ACI4QS_01450 [Comamonas sp.]
MTNTQMAYVFNTRGSVMKAISAGWERVPQIAVGVALIAFETEQQRGD